MRKNGREQLASAMAFGVAMAMIGCSGSDGNHSLPQTLTIQTYPEGAPFLGFTLNPDFVAFQDGDSGTWQALTGVGGVYQATLTQQRYAIAVGCTSDLADILPVPTVRIAYRTVDDSPEIKIATCDSVPLVASKLTVSVTGGRATATDVQVGWLGKIASGSAPNVFLASAPEGESITPMVRTGVRPPPESTVPPADPLWVYRAPTLDPVGDTDTSAAYDLDSVGAAPVAVSLQVMGAMDGEGVTGTSSLFNDAAGLHAEIGVLQQQTADLSRQYLGVPVAAGRQADDLTEIDVEAFSDQRFRRGDSLVIDDNASQVANLPAPWTVDPPTTVNASRLLFSFTFPAATPVLNHVDYLAIVDEVAEYQMSASANYVDNQALTLTTPDLSNVAGWTVAYAMSADTDLGRWTSERFDRNTDADSAPVAGAEVRFNLSTDTLPRPGAAN